MNQFRCFTIAFFLGFILVISLTTQTWGCSLARLSLTDVGSITRSQMAYHLEHSQFTAAIADLGLGINLAQRQLPSSPFALTMQVENNTVVTTSTQKSPIDRCILYLSDWLPFLEIFGRRCPPTGWLCLSSKQVYGYTGVAAVMVDAENDLEIPLIYGMCMNFSPQNEVTINRQTGEVDCGHQGKLMN
ncbi:MAG: hypothetical protein F6J87_12175 [Spirulina sp. SIO3F2]|nr:hypothetical protein [Spirulina sp. SIO3F2]